VVEQCHRPVILLAIQGEEARGSGRSIPAFHLYNALAATATHLLKFGGHQQAAGLTLSMKKFADFYDAFDRHAAETLRPDDLLPELQLDAELTAEELNSRLLDFIDMLRPFGMGNPEPVFLIRNLQVASCRTIKDTHLKLRLRSADIVVEAIGFKMAGRAAENDTVDIACVPERNVWNGRESLQLRIKDIRKAGGAGGT
jgi:single-stranded-DNA-specific exonuclease